MKNIKVKVENEQKSKEVQELFFALGAVWGQSQKALFNSEPMSFIYFNGSNIYYGHDDENDEDWFRSSSSGQELTIQQLRDMVVLKRNDVMDATHVGRSGSQYYLGYKYYYWNGFEWEYRDFLDLSILKKIKEKQMKEFLVNNDGVWTLTMLDSDTEENSYRMAVPNGADEALHFTVGCLEFYKSNREQYFSKSKDNWVQVPTDRSAKSAVWKRHKTKEFLNSKAGYILQELPEHAGDDPESGLIEVPDGADIYLKGSIFNFFSKKIDNTTYATDEDGCWFKSAFNELNLTELDVLWKRHTQLEELPFIDDELEGIGRTLQERGNQYGNFEDVAFTTESIVDAMRSGNYDNLPKIQKMALYMIASKMARIVNGNHLHKDSWHDIAGYATLIDELLES